MPPTPDLIDGAVLGVDGFYSAILRHGTWDRYEFYVAPRDREKASDRVRDMGGGRARVVPFAELRARSGDLGLTAWHAPAHELMFLPLAVRSRHATTAFPITAGVLSVSEQYRLHNQFLRLLLAETLPCDSIICPSATSRRAVEVLFDEVAARFNRRHGTRLRFGGRLDTIPVGVDTEVLRPTDQALARRSLSLPSEPLIILWLGRISVAQKADLVPLIRAFADVKHYVQGLDVAARPLMLLIAGSDPFGQRGMLEDQARQLGVADDVRICTPVEPFRRTAFYGAADIFVSPVDNVVETFGLTPVEAMACGVPQVVADWDGYRDTVAHGETGLRVPTMWMEADADVPEDPFMWRELNAHAALAQSVAVDPTAMRMALVRLVANEDLRQRMAAASRQRAEAMFSWPRVIAQLEALWAELHETAATLPTPRPAPTPDYDEPFFFHAFSHYSTRILDDSQQIRISPTGTAARGDYGELAPAFDQVDSGLLRWVLDHLGDGPVAIGDLVSTMHRELDGSYPDPVLRRQVMRLLKYGYAHIA